jgi:hypothetical protein
VRRPLGHFIFVAIIALLNAAPAHAIVLDLVPPSPTVTIGNTVDVDVVISGLANPPSVGAFDLNVGYNPAIVSPTMVTFGPFLGNPLLFEALTAFDLATLGIVNFAEVSLLSPSDLDSLQRSSFSLATLSFLAIGTAASPFVFVGDLRVDDAFGNKLLVPEPPSGLLLILALGALLATSRFRVRCRNRSEAAKVNARWTLAEVYKQFIPVLLVAGTFIAVLALLRVEAGDVTLTDGGVVSLIEVPLRWCAIEGSPAVTNPGGIGEPDTDNVLWRRHERASDNIWIPQAGITFRSGVTATIRDNMNFPIIKDPQPPQSFCDTHPKDCPYGSGPGLYGDINVNSGEFDEATYLCEQAWTAMYPDAEGPVVVNARRSVNPNGTMSQFIGEAKSSSQRCDFIINAAGAGVVIEDNQFGRTNAHDKSLAHELGHVLGLTHGDGLDNDSNGKFDECDHGEIDTSVSLMNQGGMTPYENITELQKERARAVAKITPGVKIDPPTALLDGDVVGDEVTDALFDVTNPAVDIAWLRLTVNTAADVTVFSHQLLGVIPPAQRAQYAVFVDLDENPTTGGIPANLGFSTDVQGAELVTRVLVSPEGGGTIEPTVWKFEGGGFVVQSDPRIRADVFTVIESEAEVPSYDVVSVEIPNRIIGSASTQLRIQAIAEAFTSATAPGDLDRLPDGSTDAVGVSPVPPQFASCNVVPAFVSPASAATVNVSSLLPNRLAKVILGDQLITMGPTDNDGNGTIGFNIPADTKQGPRLVTVGTAGTALTADCIVQVASSQRCDINADGVIDRNDINTIFAARGTRTAPGDPRDVDGDGVITVNDARICTLVCTKPHCAP